MGAETTKFVKALFTLSIPLGRIYPVIGYTLLFTFGVGGFVFFDIKFFFGDSPYVTSWFYSLLFCYNLLMHSILFFIHKKVIDTKQFRYSLYYSIVFSITTLIPFLLFTALYFSSCLHMQYITLIIATHVLVGAVMLGLFCYDFITTQKQNFTIYLKQPVSLGSLRFQGDNLKLINVFGGISLLYAGFVGYKILFESKGYVNLLTASIFSIGSVMFLYIVLTSFYVLTTILPKVEQKTGRPVIMDTRIYK